MNLAEMSLVALARARQSGSPDVLAERDAIDAELERRQRMLEASEEMYRKVIDGKWYDGVKIYAAAKEKP